MLCVLSAMTFFYKPYSSLLWVGFICFISVFTDDLLVAAGGLKYTGTASQSLHNYRSAHETLNTGCVVKGDLWLCSQISKPRFQEAVRSRRLHRLWNSCSVSYVNCVSLSCFKDQPLVFSLLSSSCCRLPCSSECMISLQKVSFISKN